MHGAVHVLDWVVLVAGAVCAASGLVVLGRGRYPTRRAGGRPTRRVGWSQVLVGSSVLLNAVPRLAGAPDLVVLAFSFVSLVVAGTAVAILLRTRTSA